jgi:3-isopropylmalate/(R)-2-methylmalate dehydratase small subunit
MSLAKITRVTARALAVPGDDVDTDRIIPARYLRCVTFDGLGEHAFRDERYAPDGSPKDHPMNRPEAKGAGILVAGFNFGCGSSREHAPQSLWRYGFKAIVAGSFAEIFFGNSTGIGVPCVCLSKDDLAALTAWVQANPQNEVTVDLESLKVTAGGKSYAATMPESARSVLMGGKWDSVAELLEGAGAVDALAKTIPYVR